METKVSPTPGDAVRTPCTEVSLLPIPLGYGPLWDRPGLDFAGTIRNSTAWSNRTTAVPGNALQLAPIDFDSIEGETENTPVFSFQRNHALDTDPANV